MRCAGVVRGNATSLRGLSQPKRFVILRRVHISEEEVVGIEWFPFGGKDVVDAEGKVDVGDLSGAAIEGGGDGREAMAGVEGAERLGAGGAKGDDGVGVSVRSVVEKETKKSGG